MKKLILLFLLLNFTAQAQKKLIWPGDRTATIVLTYDDGLASQLKVAIPQLEDAHFKGTFFLTGDLNHLTIPEWRTLSKKGHELANHTVYHPCTIRDDNPVASENYTVHGMLQEITLMNNFLYAVDGKITRTYAYPCTETLAGGKSYVDSLRKYGQVKYARIGGDADDAVITDFGNLDPLQVPSYGLDDNTTGAQLIAFVKKVQQSGGMGVIMFHGIGGDYISTSADAHQELLDYLGNNKKEIWVATFEQAMDHVMKVK